MSTARGIAKNFLSLTAANAVSKALGMVTVVYLARVLGVGGFGKINFSLALVNYFALFAHSGLNTIGSRAAARDRAAAPALINRIITLKLVLGLAAFAALAVFVLVMKADGDIKTLTLVYGLTMFTANVLPFDWVFQAYEKMEYLSAASVLQGLVYTGLILLCVRGGGQLGLVPWLLLAAQAAACAAMLLAFRRVEPAYSPRPDLSRPGELLAQAWPVLAAAVMIIVTLNFPLTLTGFLRGETEAGWFAAANKIPQIFIEAMLAYVFAVFPAAARLHAAEPEKLSRLLNYTMRAVLTVGLPAAAGLTLLAPGITSLLFGRGFEGAALPLAALAWTPIVVFSNNLLFHTLWAAGRQHAVTAVSALQAALTVLFCWLLVPRFGAAGAAFSALGAGLAALVWYYRSVKKTAAIAAAGFVPRPLAASAVMCAAVWPLRHSLAAAIPCGALVYAAAILLFKGVSREDLDLLAGALRHKD